MLLVLKKYLPLQCFNKQRLFYSFKKAKKMKKLVFMFVAMAAISFAACTETKAPETPVEEPVEAVVDSAAEVVDSAAEVVDSAAEAVVDSAAAAVAE